jgi:hypothetical protein
MLFSKYDLDDPDSVSKLSISKRNHTATWKHYCDSYNCALEVVFEKLLKENYGFNSKSRGLLFLLRHSFEITLKYNLSLRKIPVPITHNFTELTQEFDKGQIPISLLNSIKYINRDEDGSCYRYYRNKTTKRPYFSQQDKIHLAQILKEYNSTKDASNFSLGTICREFEYDNRKIKWALTLHVGGDYRLAQIRTQYDQIFELLIDAVLTRGLGIDIVLLPILFLIRHSLELALKDNITELQPVSNFIKPKDIEGEHSLTTLYNIYRDFLDKIDIGKLPLSTQNQLREYMHGYKQLNDVIHMLDHNSRYFLYPVDKDGKPHRIRFSKIGLVEILRLYYFTDPFINYTNYVLEDYGVVRL